MLDLTEIFGEGWCVTLAPSTAVQALRCLGVPDAVLVDDGLEVASQRLADHRKRPDVLLLGRELRDGWSLVLELEGTWGWMGTGSSVLTALSAPGRVAAAAFRDPNQLTMEVASDGAVVCELDVICGYFPRETVDEDRVVRALLAAGFTHGDEPTGRAAELDCDERAVLALYAATGVELIEEDFEGSWLVGVSEPSRLSSQGTG